jgi:hypothetical protein
MAVRKQITVKGKKVTVSGGLTQKERDKYNAKTGGNIKPGVKNYSDASDADKKRWVNWATRFYGRDTYPPLKTPSGKPTPFARTALEWGEPIVDTVSDGRKIAAKAKRRKRALDNRTK